MNSLNVRHLDLNDDLRASRHFIEAEALGLKPYVTSKGTIRFAPDKALPATLVKKMVKARIREQDARWPEG